jgi:hypothetical protein
MRKTILLFGAVLFPVVLFVTWDFVSAVHWDGFCAREIRILVLDASSAEPIPGAKVAFVSRQWELAEKYPAARELYGSDRDNLSRLHPSAQTDTTGRCKLRVEFPAGGKQTRFGGRRGTFHVEGQLDVERPGAPCVRLPLHGLVDAAPRSLDDRAPLDVTIRLGVGSAGKGVPTSGQE